MRKLVANLIWDTMIETSFPLFDHLDMVCWEKSFLAGKLRAGEEVSADSGLRMRRPNSTKVDAPKVEMPTVPAQPVQPAQPEERCPISGKQGTCPMASIMGITKESTAAPSGASTSGGSTSFMKGKSLVASVQKKDTNLAARI